MESMDPLHHPPFFIILRLQKRTWGHLCWCRHSDPHRTEGTLSRRERAKEQKDTDALMKKVQVSILDPPPNGPKRFMEEYLKMLKVAVL